MKKTLKFTFIIFLILSSCESPIEPNLNLFGKYAKFCDCESFNPWEKNTTGEINVYGSTWSGVITQNGVSKTFGGQVKVTSKNSLNLLEDGNSMWLGSVDQEGIRFHWKAKDGITYIRWIRK